MAYTPTVSVKPSITTNHLVSLIDGKSYKTLKRHLAHRGLTSDESRTRYGLLTDYGTFFDTTSPNGARYPDFLNLDLTATKKFGR